MSDPKKEHVVNKGRGGARPNTGPKPLEPKVRRSVGLSERQWRIFDALGGNDWLRKVLDAAPPDFLKKALKWLRLD